MRASSACRRGTPRCARGWLRAAVAGEAGGEAGRLRSGLLRQRRAEGMWSSALGVLALGVLAVGLLSAPAGPPDPSRRSAAARVGPWAAAWA